MLHNRITVTVLSGETHGNHWKEKVKMGGKETKNKSREDSRTHLMQPQKPGSPSGDLGSTYLCCSIMSEGTGGRETFPFIWEIEPSGGQSQGRG